MPSNTVTAPLVVPDAHIYHSVPQITHSPASNASIRFQGTLGLFNASLEANKDTLLKDRSNLRASYTHALIQHVIKQYELGFNTVRIKYNESTEENDYSSNTGLAFLEAAINHLQSKDFMCTITELQEHPRYTHEYTIYL